jgi:hypothetical protein
MDSTPARGLDWEAAFRQRSTAHLPPSEDCGPRSRPPVSATTPVLGHRCFVGPMCRRKLARDAPHPLVKGKPPAQRRTLDVRSGMTSGFPTTRGVLMVPTEASVTRKGGR